jgi:hypothetical protein
VEETRVPGENHWIIASQTGITFLSKGNHIFVKRESHVCQKGTHVCQMRIACLSDENRMQINICLNLFHVGHEQICNSHLTKMWFPSD